MTTTPVPPTVVVQAPGRSAMAIWALVAAFFLSPLGLVLGILARKKVRLTGQKGSRLAMAAIVVSIASIAFDLLVLHKAPLPFV